VLACRVLERDLVLEIGRRMHEASLVGSARDASLFGCQELLDWLQGRIDDVQVASTAQQRAAESRRWARYAPPEQIEPAAERDPESGTPSDEWLKGQAICAGRASGQARLVRSMSEASQVLPGEVLVCQEVPFELTPLFSIVAAVVAEQGDLLDHASVLAREYRIPTVFGVAEATRRIHTGDSLTVDASRGIVVRHLPEADWDLWAI
jgi:pyruvate,water dikinase